MEFCQRRRRIFAPFDMNSKVLKTLEFDKILNRLSQHAVMDIAAEEILRLVPETDVRTVEKMQQETAQALAILAKKGSPPILCSRDIRPALKRADIGGVLTCADLLEIGRVLKTARRFSGYTDDMETGAIGEHIDALYADKALETEIGACIIDNETIADDASPALLDIRRKIRSANNKVREILQKMIASPGKQKYLQEQIITLRGDRYVVPVKAEHKGDVPGIVHDVSSTGATVFIEPMSVVETNNEIRRLTTLEQDEVERILAKLSNDVATVGKLLAMSFETIALLDLLFAKAKYALATDAFMPKLNQNGVLNLIKARHPLLDEKTVVPTDIYLGKAFDTLVITGPNTGGKTVTLKTIGLLTLMAQAGLHITAAEGSEIAVFDEVFADIGDEQSIEQSLSTFSAHMVNLVDIVGKAGAGTLCLFDELGAGTDPVEGAALAISILEFVKNMGAKCAATTHYSELKLYALSTARVENASCEFDVETLAPTYRLLIGVPGKSNAFAIAGRLGLPDYLIEKAREHLNAENVKFEDVLAKLEKNRQMAEQERERAQAYQAEAASLKREMAHRNKALLEKTDKIIEKARQDAKKILDQAKDEADELLSQMRAAQKLRDQKEANRAAENARRKLLETAKKNAGALSETLFAKNTSDKPPKQVKLGDSVEIVNLKQKGTVLTLPDNKGDLLVKVGVMKMKANLSNLRLTDESAPNRKPHRQNIAGGGSKAMSMSTELDIRGQNIADATYLLDKFLDDAVLSSLHEVRIIHGKGTGALRAGIQAYLKRHPSVKHYRLAGFGEGDAGVTIAELK